MFSVEQVADLSAFECSDPVDAVDLIDLVYRLLRDHAAIADDDEVLDAKVIFELVHLRENGLRVVGVAFVNGHGDGTAAARRQQAVVHLELVARAVAVVAKLGERTFRTLEVARTKAADAIYIVVFFGEFLASIAEL